MQTISLEKAGRVFVFRYEPGEEGAAVDEIAALAADRRCPLTWYDAALLSFQVAHAASDSCCQELEADLTRQNAGA